MDASFSGGCEVDGFTEGGEKRVDGVGVVADDPGAQTVEVLVGKLEQGFFFGLLLADPLAGGNVGSISRQSPL